MDNIWQYDQLGGEEQSEWFAVRWVVWCVLSCQLRARAVVVLRPSCRHEARPPSPRHVTDSDTEPSHLLHPQKLVTPHPWLGSHHTTILMLKSRLGYKVASPGDVRGHMVRGEDQPSSHNWLAVLIGGVHYVRHVQQPAGWSKGYTNN